MVTRVTISIALAAAAAFAPWPAGPARAGEPAGEVRGPYLARAGSVERRPVVIAPAIEAQFRISDMGGTGDTSFRALTPDVAYNSQDNQYLVVWSGDDNVGGVVDSELEIFGTRVEPPLFEDDFESGDLSAWSSMTP